MWGCGCVLDHDVDDDACRDVLDRQPSECGLWRMEEEAVMDTEARILLDDSTVDEDLSGWCRCNML